MKLKLVLLCSVITSLVLLCNEGVRGVDTCTMEEESCKLSMSIGGQDSEIDLKSFTSVLTSTSAPNAGRTYYYMPCGLIGSDPSKECQDAKGCQGEGGGTFYPVGSRNKITCEIDTASLNPKVNYSGVEDTTKDPSKRGATVEFVCNDRLEGLSFSVGYATVYDDTYFYPFTTTGSGACPSSGGINGGGIFLIIYFVSIALYLIVGVCYKAFYKGARGTEMLPNTEFWLMVPGLIRDGCLYIYRTIASKTCNKSFDAV